MWLASIKENSLTSRSQHGVFLETIMLAGQIYRQSETFARCLKVADQSVLFHLSSYLSQVNKPQAALCQEQAFINGQKEGAISCPLFLPCYLPAVNFCRIDLFCPASSHPNNFLTCLDCYLTLALESDCVIGFWCCYILISFSFKMQS